MTEVAPIERARAKRTAARPIQLYQIKLTIQDSKPPIWRRLLVPSNLKLSSLHQVIQIVMGWDNSHMHHFDDGTAFYGKPDPDEWMEVVDERKTLLDRLLQRPKDKCRYVYDFGDNWEHEILLEKISEPDETWPGHPVCLKGVRACPPDDCGGIWGYYQLLETVNDPKHPEHKEIKEWLGPFDPEAFDLEGVNQRLKGMKR